MITQTVNPDLAFDEGRLIALDGALCPASCGHTGFVLASSILTFTFGVKVALIGDPVIGAGIVGNVIAGSALTNSD